MILNEGLKVLGDDGYPGVFQDSGIENIEMPSTLRKLGNNLFWYCRNLKKVSLPSRLECLED